ncbi:Uncharacterised protein [Escherichia coli]|nr:Uncharacterised protein [Escherichia coli]
MTDKDLYGGLIRLHILHHAAEELSLGWGSSKSYADTATR